LQDSLVIIIKSLGDKKNPGTHSKAVKAIDNEGLEAVGVVRVNGIVEIKNNQ
jgi:hypothetical protein